MLRYIFNELPVFRGKERLAKIIFKRRISMLRNTWVSGKFGRQYYLPNIVESIGFEIYVNGIYEKGTSDYIVGNLPENGVFLDLGANIGAVSIPVQVRRKDVKIICVEAAPWIYDVLKKNLERNDAPSVSIYNKALFYTDDEILQFYSPAEKFGKGSLSPVFTDNAIPVKTVQVDSLLKELAIQKVDIIKIDVEGFEYQVFKGATELLNKAESPDIIFEYVDWAEKAAQDTEPGSSQRILRDFGFKLYYFEPYGKMKEVEGILTEGFHMLFASKKGFKH